MEKYSIKLSDNDFKFLNYISNTKGSRTKRLAIDIISKEKAWFKYQGQGYNVSEACSEKMCYEIAKVLGYNCAKIELAKDENNQIGILNYLFIDVNKITHMDAVSYLNEQENERPYFYTVSNIKRTLDNIDGKLFNGFIRLMLFDALVGETDRHEENWGVEITKDGYEFSPLYDNGCNLLREFRNEEYAAKYYDDIQRFDAYIYKSKTYIFKEDNKHRYKHFELIEYLNEEYHDILVKEIRNLNKLTDDKIENIVNKIPNELLTDKHKEYIIYYLKKRRDILLSI